MRRSQRIQRQQTLHQINPPAILQANVRVDKQNSITNFGTLWGSMASLTSLSGLFRQYIIRAHAASQKAEGILTGSKWRVACGKGVCCLASSLSWSWTGSCGTQMIQYWSNVSWQSQLETRSSILDAFKNGESSFEARVSSIEFWVSRRSKNFSRKRFISRICNNRNKQYHVSCGFLYLCKSTCISY